MPTYTYEVTCTCDEIGEGPCPAHARENALQDKVTQLEYELAEAKKYRIAAEFALSRFADRVRGLLHLTESDLDEMERGSK